MIPKSFNVSMFSPGWGGLLGGGNSTRIITPPSNKFYLILSVSPYAEFINNATPTAGIIVTSLFYSAESGQDANAQAYSGINPNTILDSTVNGKTVLDYLNISFDAASLAQQQTRVFVQPPQENLFIRFTNQYPIFYYYSVGTAGAGTSPGTVRHQLRMSVWEFSTEGQMNDTYFREVRAREGG